MKQEPENTPKPTKSERDKVGKPEKKPIGRKSKTSSGSTPPLPSLKLIEYDPLPNRDVVATLRRLADCCEQGVYRNMDDVVILLNFPTESKVPLQVFHFGTHTSNPTFCMGLLLRGIGQLQHIIGQDYQVFVPTPPEKGA